MYKVYNIKRQRKFSWKVFGGRNVLIAALHQVLFASLEEADTERCLKNTGLVMFLGYRLKALNAFIAA